MLEAGAGNETDMQVSLSRLVAIRGHEGRRTKVSFERKKKRKYSTK